MPAVYESQSEPTPPLRVGDRDAQRAPDVVEDLQRAALVGRVAGGIAHDLAGYLTAILGFGEVLADDLEACGEHSEEITEIREAAERAARLLQRMLSLGASGAADEPRLCDPREALAGMHGILRGLVGRSVNVALDVEASPRSVGVAPSDFDRLVLNLTDNARAALRGTGSIALGVVPAAVDEDGALALYEADWRTASRAILPGLYPVAEGDPRVAAASASVSELPPPRPGRYAALFVSDDGRGMERGVRQRVFAAPPARSLGLGAPARRDGHGLGLANVREILERAGGGARAWSASGRGTTVCLLLPLVEGPVPLAETRRRPSEDASAPAPGPAA